SLTDTGLQESTRYFYRVIATNAAGDSAPSASVSKTISRPVGTIDTYSIVHDHTLTTVPSGGVLNNDASTNGEALTAALVAGPSHGTLILNADGSFSYAPTAGYLGSDSFTYRVSAGPLPGNVAAVSI